MTNESPRRLRALRNFFLGLAFSFVPFIAPASAGKIHPALWTAHSRTATVYLLGSIHVLPIGMNWRTPEIDHAMESANTFYFETSIDPESVSEIARWMRYHGDLPDRVTLRSLLDKQTLADYQHALSLTGLSANALDGDRPWRAAGELARTYARQMGYRADLGVDYDVWEFAKEHQRALRAFETTQQQIDLAVPKDQKLELAQFAATVKDIEVTHKQYEALIAAWSAGNVERVAQITNEGLGSEPYAKKIMLDDRNKSWMKWFDQMLSAAGTCFVTVGAGHMVGPSGVPALLRARGYRVEGP